MSEEHKANHKTQPRIHSHHGCNCQGRCKVCRCRQPENGQENLAPTES